MKHADEILESIARCKRELKGWLRPASVCASLLLGLSALGSAQNRANDLTDLSLEQLGELQVTSASLHEQSLEDAPASTTVITAEEIRKFGYRTLGEALSYVPGFFTSTDHTYTYLGVRGFSLPGDYDTRVIVMIDGHNIADNVLDEATWFGNDFPVDMNLVEKIEVVRGASSALYGSNGMLATINVVTKRPAEDHGTSVRLETGSLGERKVEVGTAVALPHGANLLFSTAVFNNSGADQLYFSEFDTPKKNFGRAVRMDGEKGYHAFADLTWGNWEILAVAGDRVKQQPISWNNTVFNDTGTRAEDSRGFVDVAYTKDLPRDRTLSWRTSYDEYRYRGIYRYSEESAVEDTREHDYGDWVGSKLTYRLPDSAAGHLTVGADFQYDLRVLMNVFDFAPVKADVSKINRPDRYAGTFAQQEWELGKQWEVNLGARFDWVSLKRSSLSPRIAVIYKPVPKTDLKILYSRGFRNPSSYEMFYTDSGQIPNLSLRPETVDSYELDIERELTRRMHVGASAYRYLVNNLIEQVYTPDGMTQYVNQDRVRADGVSFEVFFRLPASIDLASSLEIQRAVFGSGTVLPNSPGQVGKLHLSMPLWRDRLTLGAGLQALGQRSTYAGATLSWMMLPEAVVSTKPLAAGLQFSAEVKNLSNSFYRDPVGLTPTVDSMIGTGRTYYLSVTWHSAERESAPKAGIVTASPQDKQ